MMIKAIAMTKKRLPTVRFVDETRFMEKMVPKIVEIDVPDDVVRRGDRAINDYLNNRGLLRLTGGLEGLGRNLGLL